MSKNSKKVLLLAASFAGACSLVSSVFAESINLDTTATGSSWLVSGGGPNSSDIAAPGEAVTAVTTSFPLSAWVSAGTVNSKQTASDGLSHSAAWVSTDSSGGGTDDVNGSAYVFSDTFTVTSPDFASLALSGTYSTDNWIGGMSLNYTISGQSYSDTIIPTSVGGDEYTYQAAYNFSGSASNGFATPQSFTLSVDVVNSYGPGSSGYVNNSPPGPVGLILAGTAVSTALPGADTATAVPLPASAGMGFSTLGVIGMLTLARRKMNSSKRMISTLMIG